MKKINTRFGEVEYDPEKTIYFPEGLIGFESLREFLVIPNRKPGPLFWIQSVEDPLVAFVLTDPSQFFPEYLISPDGRERMKLEICAEDLCYALSVVTILQDRTVTLNLQAPVLFAPKNNRALQVILENSSYSTRTPLPLI